MLCDARGCDEVEHFVFPSPTNLAAGGYLVVCGGGSPSPSPSAHRTSSCSSSERRGRHRPSADARPPTHARAPLTPPPPHPAAPRNLRSHLEATTDMPGHGTCPLGVTSTTPAPTTTTTFVAVVAGTVASFDSAAFKNSLAKQLAGVTPSDITLIVSAIPMGRRLQQTNPASAGSVKVTATITTVGAAAAASVSTTLAAFTPAALSAALGVTVTSVPAPDSGTPAGGGADSNIGIIAGAAGGGALVLALVTWSLCKKSKGRDEQLKPQSA